RLVDDGSHDAADSTGLPDRTRYATLLASDNLRYSRGTHMAKTKVTGTTTSTKKSAPPQRAAKPAPDTPSMRPGNGQASGNTAAKLSPEEVYRLIQESAYFKAKERGF